MTELFAGLPALLTVPQFSREAGIKEATTRAWVLRRRVSFVKLGGKSVRIPRTELERLFREGLVPAREGRHEA